MMNHIQRCFACSASHDLPTVTASEWKVETVGAVAEKFRTITIRYVCGRVASFSTMKLKIAQKIDPHTDRNDLKGE